MLRNEVLGGPNLKRPLTRRLSGLELERMLSPKEAAELLGISQDTFLRHYRHLIRKVSVRRSGVRLGDLLNARDEGLM